MVVFELTSFALALLMVFRTNTAHLRWWEVRGGGTAVPLGLADGRCVWAMRNVWFEPAWRGYAGGGYVWALPGIC